MSQRLLLPLLAALVLGSACDKPDQPPVPSFVPTGAVNTLEATVREQVQAGAAMEQAAGGNGATQVVAVAERDPANGEILYGRYCTSCHGTGGNGDGPAAAGLEPKPTRHTDGSYMNTLSDAHLYKVIDEGGLAVGKAATMSAWGSVMSNREIWDVVAYTRSLADPPYPGEQP